MGPLYANHEKVRPAAEVLEQRGVTAEAMSDRLCQRYAVMVDGPTMETWGVAALSLTEKEREPTEKRPKTSDGTCTNAAMMPETHGRSIEELHRLLVVAEPVDPVSVWC
jgi:hypothetical protein